MSRRVRPALPLVAAATAAAAAAPATAQPDKAISIEAIAQDIAAAIVEKRLPPGTWLREEPLGKVYSVSRTKIRAALVMLAKDRLVETIPDKGSFVSRPSEQEAREIFDARRLLESEVVRRFVANAGPRDYRRLEERIRIERATLKVAAAGGVREKLLGDFHVALVESTGHGVLTALVTDLVARSSLIAMLYQSSNDPHCSSDEHAELMRVCRTGDADAAVAEMLAHLDRVEANLRLDGSRREPQPDLVRALIS